MLRDVLIQKGLSNREAEVAELVTKGLSNKEVANQLFVTEKTVKFHLTNIYKKMCVKSRAQLIVWCMPHLGFVEKEERQSQATTNQTQELSQPAQETTNTIPAGNATVAQSIPIINRVGNGIGTGGSSSGNSDAGAFGL